MNKFTFKQNKTTNYEFWLLVFLFNIGLTFIHKANAQGANSNMTPKLPTQAYTIVFGDNLPLGNISTSTTWQINFENKPIASGAGEGLNSFIFERPGAYEIDIQEHIDVKPNSCNHSHLPAKVLLTVSPIKMKFDLEQAKLSAHPKVGVETKGITISVPVEIETYGNPSLVLTDTEIKTIGIRTDIVAKLKGSNQLKKGKQTLVYELSGMVHDKAYVMFNFIDINQQYQSFGYQKMIE